MPDDMSKRCKNGTALMTASLKELAVMAKTSDASAPTPWPTSKAPSETAQLEQGKRSRQGGGQVN